MIACSAEDDLTVSQKSESPKPANKFRISLEDASNRAESIINLIEKERHTRSNGKRTIRSVDYYINPSTRGGESIDTLLYLINYGDEQGFALVSADERLDPVYAISDEGHLNFSDTI